MGRETWLSMSFEASTFRMIEATRLFLLDQVSEDADVFGLQNLNREDFRRVTSKNKAVEGEKLRGIGSCDRLVHFGKEKTKNNDGDVNLSQGSVYGAHQWVLVPKCVHAHPPELHRKLTRSSSQSAIFDMFQYHRV